MQKIVLVRHATATGQDANAPLTIEGQRQSIALADLLLQLQIERVISSLFVRAIESVEAKGPLSDFRICLGTRARNTRDRTGTGLRPAVELR